jgi:hypothetical protein
MTNHPEEISDLLEELAFLKGRASYWRDYYYALKNFMPP